MSSVSSVQYDLPGSENLLRLTVVDDRRCQQGNAPVVVLVIVPVEELLAETVTVFLGAESIRKVRPVLEGLELAFRKRIVIGDVRPAVRFGDT